MTDLLERLQGATEGSRELDLQIAFALNRIDGLCDSWVRSVQWSSFADEIVLLAEPGQQKGALDPRFVRHCTTNLQDAVSLVPAGERYDCLMEAISWCMLRDGFEADDWAAYLARSVCIAIIKVHESKAEAA